MNENVSDEYQEVSTKTKTKKKNTMEWNAVEYRDLARR